MTAHTQKGVLTSLLNMVSIPSTQEEADTLLILCVSGSESSGQYCARDTDVLVLVL